MAILLQRPDNARARPSSLLKNDNDYRKVYSPDYPILLYFNCAAVMQRVENLLKDPKCKLSPKDRNNVRFYVAAYVVADVIGKKTPTATDIGKLDPTLCTAERIEDSFKIVKALYEELGASDQVAKSPALKDRIETFRELGV
jgi:hypothetical protein